MPERTFEFCALKYLLLWSQQEKEIHEGMSVAKGRPEVSDLRKALKHFRIARNFRNIKDGVTAKGVINSLLKVSSDDTQFPKQKVINLADQFQDTFGQFNLSAASKLLWLRHRSPFLIFDDRAFRSLQSLSQTRFKKRDYSKYVSTWRSTYDQHRNAIKQAVIRLPDALPFVRDWYQSKEEIESLASQDWFQERIFDIYLWELGGNEQPVSQ